MCKSYALQRQQKIDEALKLLEDTFPPSSKKHLKYDIRAKELKVILCYENVLAKKGEGKTIDDLERNIENLKKYCKRLLRDDFLTEQTAAPHRNFHRVAAKFYLVQSKDTFDKKKVLIQKIQKLLTQKEPISNRTWIKKQLALLEKRNEREFL